MSLTIKAGTAYDAPWYVIDETSHEAERERLLQFSDLMEDTELPDGRKVHDLSLLELTVVVGRMFNSAWMGGTAAPAAAQRSGSKPAAKPAAKAQEKPVEEEPQEPAADPADTLLAAIGAAASKRELQQLFMDNKDFLGSNDPLMEAMKARMADFA